MARGSRLTAPGPIAGALAFFSCVILVPIVTAFSVSHGFLDSPGPLKIHSRPIPRLGGIAIVISLSLGVLLSGRPNSFAARPFFAALALIWIAGVHDDIRGSSPFFRLVAQIAGASILWYGDWRLPVLGGSKFGLIALCLFIIIFVNAFNFLDGSDGIAAGVAVVIAVSYILQSNAGPVSFSSELAWPLAGACLGFLIFNFPPANIFMGDSGSTVVGLAVALLVLNSSRAHGSAALPFLFATFPAALPLLDAASVVIRRLLSGRSPFYGDRRHFYDLLLSRGWSRLSVGLFCYGITGIFCVAGWLASNGSHPRAFITLALSLGGFSILEWRVGSFRVSEIGPPRRDPASRFAWFFGNPN